MSKIDGESGPARRLSTSSRLRRTPGIAWRMVEEEAILVNVRRDEVIHLDPVGSFIWSRMDGQTTLQEIGQSLVGTFEVSLETAMEDMFLFAERLIEQGAVEVVDLE
jgi:hypothetical protein